MFLYWDGYEIDGSDTDFDIILPEQLALREFVDCFLQTPLFDRSLPIEISYVQQGKRVSLTRDELHNLLNAGDFPDIEITINCLHPEELEKPLLEEIYAISARREPPEPAFGKVEQPCCAPFKQKYYTRGEMTVTLMLGHDTAAACEEPWEGYVNNIELLRDAGRALPCVAINVGPSFYYEYAIYLIDYLRDSFPSIATCGGLDCAGGWTDGCTYANSLYNYELIERPVAHSVKNTLKRLLEYNILCPGLRVYQKNWVNQRTEQFYQTNNNSGMIYGRDTEKLPFITFAQYVDLSETALASGGSAFETACATAVHILLPDPKEFAACPRAAERLKQIFESCGCVNEWYYKGYFCFVSKNGQHFAQFRIPYPMKPYLLALLDGMDSGIMEEIKPLTYQKRHEQ